MKLSENWYVDAPWAQLVCSTKIPDDKIKKFIGVTDDILEKSHGLGTKEVVPSSWIISPEKFQEFGVLEFIMQMIDNYMITILSNGNVKQHMDSAFDGGPHTAWHSRIVDAWVVSQKEDDYLPVHAHSQLEEDHQLSKISAVMYLKIPTQMERKPDQASIKMGKDGQLSFTGMGDADPFQTTSLYNIIPEVGWLYLFPSTLNHQVYPFKGEGERRGIAFNADFISQEQLEKIKR